MKPDREMRNRDEWSHVMETARHRGDSEANVGNA